MRLLQDNFFRVIDYLRLSVIDRCNLQCIYCTPGNGIVPFAQKEILTYEEMTRLVRIASGLGVRKVRLTGGEPLLRKNIAFLVSSVRKLPGIEDLSMTTNGLFLEKHAEELAAAGLDRVNVSIDSFDTGRYRKITGKGKLAAVLRGVKAAQKAGLRPVKINMVPIRGLNDDEILNFAKLTLTSDLHVRFIEFMPSACVDFWSPEKYLSTDEIKRSIETISPLTPVRLRKNGPSKYFRLKGAQGVVGFISALTHHFCEDCNRIRITADGKIRPCLFSETEIDLKSSLRNSAPDEEIERLLRLSVEIKPKGHSLENRGPEGRVPKMGQYRSSLSARNRSKRPMSKIGG